MESMLAFGCNGSAAQGVVCCLCPQLRLALCLHLDTATAAGDLGEDKIPEAWYLCAF